MKTTRRKSEAGFSLVELIIVSAVLVFIIGILTAIISNVRASYARERPRIEALDDATAALDMMTRLIRMAGNNPSNITMQAIDAGSPDAAGVYHTIRIRGNWRGNTAGSPPDNDITDPFEDVLFSVQNNTLMKREFPADTASVEFLDNVSDLRFTYYDTNNILIPNPVTSAGLISRIDMEVVTQASGTPPITFNSSAFTRQK